MTPLDTLLYWVREREVIRLRKEAGEPWPWTSDPILQRYSFCCVRREDDRVTRWINEHIRRPYADHPHLWWMLCAARQINWPDTLAELIEQGAWPDQAGFRPEQVSEILTSRSARGDKVYTGAYIIRPAGSDRQKLWFSWPKSRYIAEVVLGYPWRDRERFVEHFSGTPTLQSTVEMLLDYFGYGPFMAYQSVVDMRFTRLLRDAPDRDCWAAAGLGTLRGLNRVAGRPVRAPLRQDQALEEMRVLYPYVKEVIPTADFSDVPNVCCEYDKYIRVWSGEGRLRAQYWRYRESTRT